MMTIKFFRLSGSGDSMISDKEYQLAISLLQLIRSSCSSNPETAALFMDELANITASGTLDTKIEVCLFFIFQYNKCGVMGKNQAQVA